MKSKFSDNHLNDLFSQYLVNKTRRRNTLYIHTHYSLKVTALNYQNVTTQNY